MATRVMSLVHINIQGRCEIVAVVLLRCALTRLGNCVHIGGYYFRAGTRLVQSPDDLTQ